MKPSLSEEQKGKVISIWKENGKDIKAAAAASSETYQQFYRKLYTALGGPPQGQKASAKSKREPSPLHARRHFVIGDTQARPGVPKCHYDWIGRAIVDYLPDCVIHLGDNWDHPSLSMHNQDGSIEMENQRYLEDVRAGDEAFQMMFAPMYGEIERRKNKSKKNRWDPRRIFLKGNHEDRADRFSSMYPKFRSIVTSENCNTLDFEVYPFGQHVEVDGILYNHFFSNPSTGRPIGGTVQNRLNHIKSSFVQGHQQGFQYGTAVTPTGKTVHGLVLGSTYLHREEYRRCHNTHFRGLAVLNETKDGDYCLMTLSLDFLCRRYEKMTLVDYMNKTHPGRDWSYLA